MKIRIAKGFDQAARTVLVAGSFAIPSALLAQTAPYRVPDPPASIASAGEGAKRDSPMAKPPRLLEMDVELAWLADPTTSPWRLQARTVGGAIEVRGQVPNEVVLGQALQIARVESGMPAVSKVQLNSMLGTPRPSKPQEILHREAFDALRKGFPSLAPAITVSTRADGQIVLKGTVPTHEDKWAISRHLREATVCSSVVNQLQVLAERQESFAQSSSPSVPATMLPVEHHKPEQLLPAAHVWAPEPVPATAMPQASGETTAMKGSPSGFKGSMTGSEESLAAKSTDPATATHAQPAPEKQPAAAAKPAAKPLVYQTKWRRLDPSEVALPKKSAPAAPSKESGGTTKPEALATSSTAPRTFLRVIPSAGAEAEHASSSTAVEKTDTTHLPKQPPQFQSNPIQPVAATTDLPAPKPPPAPAPAALASPVAMPPARQPAPLAAKREPMVSEGVIIVESAIKPAAQSPSASAPKPPPVLRTGRYVTNGVILFSEPANENLMNANPALRALQVHLQQRIAAVCGKSSNDVEVTAVTETNVTVRVRARSTLEGEDLSNRIFQLPELVPCQVSLDVLVMK